MNAKKKLKETLSSKTPIGAIFRHYSGREYKILHIGHHSEDHCLCVVYQALYHCGDFGKYPIWIRPLELFLENVEKDGKEVSRFTLVHQPSPVHE